MRATEFVNSYFDAWNHGDPTAVADHLDADGVYRDIPEDIQRSHDELVVSLEKFFSRYRHRYELIGEILNSRDTIAFQYRMCSLGKGGNGMPTGSYRGAEFMTMHGDAAMTIIDYYEMPGASGPSPLAGLKATGRQKPKYAKSGLRSDQMLEYKDKLEFIMRSQKAYLHSNLTLPSLAQSMGCSVNHLSQVINSGFDMSFFDYLNHFRVDHAKELLSERGSQNKAVLNIAFKVGFNSNSAFYSAFKKCVGQTPAQYRRSQLRKAH